MRTLKLNVDLVKKYLKICKYRRCEMFCWHQWRNTSKPVR